MERPFEALWDALTQNLPTKLVSVLIALVLWVVVLGSGVVEENKEIALEVVTSSDLVVANDLPERVTFRLAGPKAALRTALNRRYEPIRINLVGTQPGIVTHRFFSDQIRLPIGVRVVGVTPNALIIKTEALVTRSLAVKVRTSGEAPAGLQITQLEAVPPAVSVSGPESRMAGLVEVSTAPIDLATVTGSEEREVAFDLLGTGLESADPATRVRITVEGVSANFKIKNVALKVLSRHKAKLEPATVTAMVRALPADLRKLDRAQVYGEIRASGRSKGSSNEPVHIILPPNVQLVRTIPDTVKLTLY